MVHQPVQLSDELVHQFREQGFLILDKFLDLELVDQINTRLDLISGSQYETGTCPDEFHGRTGSSQPNAVQQITNVWRCDRTIASFSFSAEIARLNATLGGWVGARFALDNCWVKPPGSSEVAFHRNRAYVSCIDPSSVITCWIALTDLIPEAGTLEVASQSHQWVCSDQVRFLHAPVEDYRQPLRTAAFQAGVKHPEIIQLTIPRGGCVFIHGDLWRGLGKNTTQEQKSRSFAVSSFPMHAQFQPPGVGYGYIFERYRMIGSLEMDESFFPILWTPNGYRTPMVEVYCQDALVPSVAFTSSI
ncbi:phytanoyl-CoA dioxygenase family protein [Scytonema sp. UIC 10036]|uniref:phytanoyl-CoA dioxygenase family protein n=1 Tax=Scytonema sp. UIC 10036 TaxID=2304196 RepID=UPI0012DA62AC|nr:phytanoyl-CoA dioxygenase family protein [Scytonema sp. UIC 10036]MUG91829.1 phytanoyl-CoA dioxygenase family protein [Scytonema sp. UIC 10036]